jgi:hypothetical protein
MLSDKAGINNMPPPITVTSVNKTTVSLLAYDVKEVINVTYF